MDLLHLKQKKYFVKLSIEADHKIYVMKIIIFAGELSKGRKTEIIPISTSRENSVGPSKEQKQILLSSEEKNERPAFYTDRYFSSNFLSDSIPLSQMIRRN